MKLLMAHHKQKEEQLCYQNVNVLIFSAVITLFSFKTCLSMKYYVFSIFRNVSNISLISWSMNSAVHILCALRKMLPISPTFILTKIHE